MKGVHYLLNAAFAMFVVALAPANVHAAYPERPLYLIVPYPPGGLTDAVARTVATQLSERLKQPIVVENVGGGGGNIGANKAAKAAPDGYTLYIGNNATVGINTLIYKDLPFDPIREFAPISLVAESQTILVVHPSLPVRSVSELAAIAKSKPGELNFGSTGTGGLSHLASELLYRTMGAKVIHVAYKGTGPATADLLAGRVQLMFNDTVVPHIQAGKLKALAVTGTKRWSQLPDVPTLAELGVAGYETYNWFGILAPAATPRDIIARLNRELVAIMRDPAMQAWMQSRGAEAASNSPEEFAAYIKKDLEKWSRVVKEVGVTAQ